MLPIGATGEQTPMTRLYFVLSLALTVAALAGSLLLYPRLADQIPIHWNIQGQVDGYGAKSWAAFFMPEVMAGLLVLFLALPWLSPKHFEVDAFRSTYWFIAFVILCLMAYIHGLMLWSAAAGAVDTTRALLAGVLLMFGLMGNVLGKVRRNFWVGVRTPWTLANERVWNDTHRLAARLFVAAAVLGLAVMMLPLPLPAVSIGVFTLIIAAAVWSVLYSLVHYKRLERRGEI
jgi:uncharacterized membrane protein